LAFRAKIRDEVTCFYSLDSQIVSTGNGLVMRKPAANKSVEIFLTKYLSPQKVDLLLKIGSFTHKICGFYLYEIHARLLNLPEPRE